MSQLTLEYWEEDGRFIGRLVDARSVLARVAVRNHGYKGVGVPEALSMSPSSVSRIVETGENIFVNKKDVAVKIADMEI